MRKFAPIFRAKLAQAIARTVKFDEEVPYTQEDRPRMWKALGEPDMILACQEPIKKKKTRFVHPMI